MLKNIEQVTKPEVTPIIQSASENSKTPLSFLLLFMSNLNNIDFMTHVLILTQYQKLLFHINFHMLNTFV